MCIKIQKRAKLCYMDADRLIVYTKTLTYTLEKMLKQDI